MHLNEAYSKISVGKNRSVAFPISETRRFIVVIAFHLCFRIRHQKGPRILERAGIEWKTPVPTLC
jgi:hypothetical protein